MAPFLKSYATLSTLQFIFTSSMMMSKQNHNATSYVMFFSVGPCFVEQRTNRWNSATFDNLGGTRIKQSLNIMVVVCGVPYSVPFLFSGMLFPLADVFFSIITFSYPEVENFAFESNKVVCLIIPKYINTPENSLSMSEGQPSPVCILSKYHSYAMVVQLLCTCYKLQEYNVSPFMPPSRKSRVSLMV